MTTDVTQWNRTNKANSSYSLPTKKTKIKMDKNYGKIKANACKYTVKIYI